MPPARPHPAGLPGTVLGVGIDVLQLSRLQALLHRHSVRLAAGSPTAVPEFLRPGPVHAAPPYTIAAAAKLAHRIFAPDELAAFLERLYGGSLRADGSPHVNARPPRPHDRVVEPAILRILALRWTAKEAAFKALQPHISLRWYDLQVSKRSSGISSGRLARLQLSETPLTQANGAGPEPWILQDRALGKKLKRSDMAATPVSGDSALEQIAQLELEAEQSVLPTAPLVDEGAPSGARSGKPFLEFTPVFHRRWTEARAPARGPNSAQGTPLPSAAAAGPRSLGGPDDPPSPHDSRIELHLSVSHDAGLVLAQVTAQLVPFDAPRPWEVDVLRNVRF